MSRFLLSLRRVVYYPPGLQSLSEGSQALESIRFQVPDRVTGNLGEMLDLDDENTM